MEKIEDIRKNFKDEWLLIAVDEIDPATGEPSKGHLLAHGSDRRDVHGLAKDYNGSAYVVYSDDWPEDLAACFLLL